MNALVRSWLYAAERFGAATTADDDARAVQAIAIALGFAVVVVAAFWAALYWAYGERLAAAVPAIDGVLFGLNLARLRATRDFQGFWRGQAAIILTGPPVLTAALGGFELSSGVIVWSFLAPLVVLVFGGPRQGLAWFAAFGAVLLVTGVVAGSTRASNALPPPVILAFFVLNIGILAMIVFGTLGLLAAQRAEALDVARDERRRADGLLRNVLPEQIAERLKRDEGRIAEHFDAATILFADVVGFTPMSATMAPAALVDLLDRLFTAFDGLVDAGRLEKIKTVGDAYMVAAGVPVPRPDHARAAARLALEMQALVGAQTSEWGVPVRIRIGMHSGPVVAGVLGRRRFLYDLWGDTVNIASRMESQGEPGRIQVSEATFDLIRDAFECEPRGRIEVKGRGELATWFVLAERHRPGEDGTSSGQEPDSPERYAVPVPRSIER